MHTKMLPMLYLVSYEPLNFNENHAFEQSLRHIEEYDALLTQMERLSAELSDVLNELSQTAPKSMLEELEVMHSDYEYFEEMMVDSTSETNYDYCRDMMNNISEHLNVLEEEIKSNLNKELYERANGLYEELYFLEIDKYNDFDKYYFDMDF